MATQVTRPKFTRLLLVELAKEQDLQAIVENIDCLRTMVREKIYQIDGSSIPVFEQLKDVLQNILNNGVLYSSKKKIISFV